jgi:tetratricopeptide (TPR) repeat protein
MMRLSSNVGIFLASALIAIMMIGCAAKEGLDFESGLKKFEAKDYDEAIAIFQQIASEEGEYTNRARFYLGECYKYQFKWDQAVAEYQKVVDSEPRMSFLASEARDAIARIREGRRDIERLKILHENNPGTEIAADSLLELGSVYENKLEDFQNAIKTYNQLIEEFPGSPKAAQAQINIGNLYFYKLYDYNKAWAEFKKVNSENYPELKFRISEVESFMRDANKTFQEITELQAFIDESQKRKIVPGRRISGYDLYGVKQEQVAQTFVAVAKKWTQLKNYPRALNAYEVLIERLPLMLRQVAEARFGVAEIYQSQARYFEAIDAYDEYISKHPTDFRRDEAIYNMAICYESLRNYTEAYETYRTYRDTYPEGKFYRPAELKVRQYEYDEDQDGYAYYQEIGAGTSDTDPSQHP